MELRRLRREKHRRRPVRHESAKRMRSCHPRRPAQMEQRTTSRRGEPDMKLQLEESAQGCTMQTEAFGVSAVIMSAPVS